MLNQFQSISLSISAITFSLLNTTITHILCFLRYINTHSASVCSIDSTFHLFLLSSNEIKFEEAIFDFLKEKCLKIRIAFESVIRELIYFLNELNRDSSKKFVILSISVFIIFLIVIYCTSKNYS